MVFILSDKGRNRLRPGLVPLHRPVAGLSGPGTAARCPAQATAAAPGSHADIPEGPGPRMLRIQAAGPSKRGWTSRWCQVFEQAPDQTVDLGADLSDLLGRPAGRVG